jgi:WD40 repeat protein
MTLDTTLPVEGERGDQRKEPWLLHSLSVNALNFCAFAMCYDQDERKERLSAAEMDAANPVLSGNLANEIASVLMQPEPANRAVILAVSNALDSGAIDFFHLPSERRVCTLPADKEVKTGMVMALSLRKHPFNGSLIVVSGYESGHAMVHVQQVSKEPDQPCLFRKVLARHPHSQPLLSLDISPTSDLFFTSSADAIIAKFVVSADGSTSDVVDKSNKIINTKHAGQQGLKVRSDGKIFATAGWDARIRVYSAKAMRELAVLKWHKEGCYAVSFATIHPEHVRGNTELGSTIRELDASLQSSALDAIKDQRNAKAKNTHWLAAGGKDGKISLWDIY